MEEFTSPRRPDGDPSGRAGLPWDKKQTEQAFKTYLLEEVYELIEAIQHEDYAAMKEELGDLLFHIVFMPDMQGKATVRHQGGSPAAFEKMYATSSCFLSGRR